MQNLHDAATLDSYSDHTILEGSTHLNESTGQSPLSLIYNLKAV